MRPLDALPSHGTDPTVIDDAMEQRYGTDPTLTQTSAHATVEGGCAVTAAAYGFTPHSVQRLPGEADDNFAVTSQTGGRRYLLKVLHTHGGTAVASAQTAVLQHVHQQDPTLPVPIVVPTTSGDAVAALSDGPLRGRSAYLTTFLTGTPMTDVEVGSALRAHVGATLALLGRALELFDHPHAHRATLWDLGQAADLKPYVLKLDPSPDRDLLVECIDRFCEDTLPAMHGLRAQVVHNDFSRNNLFVGDDTVTVSGIADFGDMVHTSLINDLAVAAAYQLGDGVRLIPDAGDVIGGYHSVTPLTARERDVLPELILARMAQRIAITEWRAARFPDNKPYILRNTPRTWHQLRTLLEIPRQHLREQIHSYCELGDDQ